jgi:hypothetical protein
MKTYYRFYDRTKKTLTSTEKQDVAVDTIKRYLDSGYTVCRSVESIVSDGNGEHRDLCISLEVLK